MGEGRLECAGGGLLETLVTFLDQGLSVEAAARALFVHANTVRYRLRRIHEVTGYRPTDPRDAYALRLAVTLGDETPRDQSQFSKSIVPSDPTKTAAPWRTSQRAERAIRHSER